MKLALVYDWLTEMAGGERTVLEVMNLYQAPLYTLFHDKKRLKGSPFEEKEIITSFLQKVPGITRLYRYLLPLFPVAIEQFNLSSYDAVISISHAVAKGVLTRSDQPHFCYCFTPVRYGWDLYHTYLEKVRVGKLPARLFLHYLRLWDSSSHTRVDAFAANSHYTARRIFKVYGRRATVIHPPVATHLFKKEKKEEFYITVSRLVPYKRIDLLAEAFSYLEGRRLLIVGEGSEMEAIKKKAGRNVELLGRLSDTEVRRLIGQARAFLFAADEDFGIAPVEAQAAGTPVIAFKRGGACETVVDGVTGLFFEAQEVQAIVDAVLRFEMESFDPDAIIAHAERFSEERFRNEFRAFVSQKMQEFHESHHLGGRERHTSLAPFSE